jgi:hypothetical protein
VFRECWDGSAGLPFVHCQSMTECLEWLRIDNTSSFHGALMTIHALWPKNGMQMDRELVHRLPVCAKPSAERLLPLFCDRYSTENYCNSGIAIFFPWASGRLRLTQ